MQILPVTGGGPGNPWVFAIRNNGVHVFDVIDFDCKRGHERAKEIIRRLEIAEIAIQHSDRELTERGRCAPNCPVCDSGNFHEIKTTK